MLKLIDIHHIAIIASDYERSKAFYCDVLGFSLINEVYRAERDSWKGDLALNERYLIELFFFPRAAAAESTGRRRAVCGIWPLRLRMWDRPLPR